MRLSATSVLFLLSAGCGFTGGEGIFRVSDGRIDDLVEDAPWPEKLGRREEPGGASVFSEPRKLDVGECVALALENNRRLLAQLEQTFLAQIDAAIAVHGYWPLLQPLTVTSTVTDPDDAGFTRADSVTTGVSKRLPFGGTASVTATGSGTHAEGPDTYSLTPTVSVKVPLWRGAGVIAANSDLIGALRAAKYASRELEHLRQVLAIDIVRQYFSLLQQRKSIVNFETNLVNARKLRDQSEALYRFGRVTKTDLFRAELQVTQAENDLLNARENLKIAEDTFKIELALAPETPLDLGEEEVAVKPLELDESAFLEDVRSRNLRWITTQEQFEDEKRVLHLAKDVLNPKVDFSASYTFAESSEKPLEDYRKDPETWSAALSVEIPLDRAVLRRDYHRAVVRYLQAERSFHGSRDELSRQARLKIVAAKQADFNVRLQKRAVEEAEKAVRLLTYEYRQGKVANRDVIEAQNKLITAQNQHLRSLVDARVVQLDLRQFAGRLEVDAEGRWLRE